MDTVECGVPGAGGGQGVVGWGRDVYELQLTYNSVLVLGVPGSDAAFLYLTK